MWRTKDGNLIPSHPPPAATRVTDRGLNGEWGNIWRIRWGDHARGCQVCTTWPSGISRNLFGILLVKYLVINMYNIDNTLKVEWDQILLHSVADR